MKIYAWIGEDEFGSGKTGLKIGKTPAGYIPLAAMDFHLDRLARLKPQMETQAAENGKRIYLAEFEFKRIAAATAKSGSAK